MNNEPKKMWLKVEGKIVSDGKIEARSFANLLLNLQKAINILSEYRFRKQLKRDIFKLYLSKMSRGSLVVELQPSKHAQTILSGYPFNAVAEDLLDFILSLDHDPEEFKERVEEKFSVPANRIRFLQNLKEIWSEEEKYTVSTAIDSKMPEDFIVLNPSRKGYIEKLIDEYKKMDRITLKGVIIRIKGDDPVRHFVIETITGEKIKCYYPPELESTVKKFYKSPITVEGIVSKKVRTAEIEELLRLDSFSVYITNKIGKFELSDNLAFSVSYDEQEDLWCVENDELAIYGYESTFQDAVSNLEESLRSLLIGFLAFPDEKLNEKSKEIKLALSKYIDIDKYKKVYDPFPKL